VAPRLSQPRGARGDRDRATRARRKAVRTRLALQRRRWTFDGTTLRFTREIATAPPDRPMPLVLRVI